MNKFSTLAAAAVFSLGAFSAQAQFTVNGVLAPAEIGTGAGKYQLVGTYTNTHSVADRGLKQLYVGTTATTLNVMLVASPEKTDYNALVFYLDMPNKTGIAAGTRLPGGDDTSSQLRHRPTLDFQADYGFRITVSPLSNTGTFNVYLSKLDYTVAPNTAGKYPDKYLGPTDKTGAVLSVTDATTNIVGAKFAYRTTTSVAANTTTGWEFELPLTALGGASANDVMNMMAGYVGDNGDFYSDVLPQVAGQITDLGLDPNFSLIAGRQSFAYQVGNGPLASRAATAAALNLEAYPNPVTAASQLRYAVAGSPQPVSVEVYNSLGQQVLRLLDAEQQPGQHATSLAPLRQLAAGNYLVKLRVGTQLTSRRVAVQ
ncbi:T9SS type A sorting domain-containing protein [Hymenobacter jeollabukensis]|uniref:T9SS type A sorting domain-containing protein n=1 Tax=Hymenobacter jeollabukensis TaxID=2025313 RepID=A0A5R8WYR4_9BACT|nr:T9SS type A sorting domain-containing protein [Hymenobacter jeollabukensis]TLM97163.1 T9SS type A sorting domain-containing protein [Hymenobacter jeollabukensis]